MAIVITSIQHTHGNFRKTDTQIMQIDAVAATCEAYFWTADRENREFLNNLDRKERRRRIESYRKIVEEGGSLFE